MAQGINRVGALAKAFEFIYKSEIDGDYHEYGVYQGVSIARALRENLSWQRKSNRNHVKNFFGFDSFQGLPIFTENDRLADYKIFHEGQFSDTSTDIVRKKILEEGLSVDNVELIEGMFSKTLSDSNVITKIGDSRVAIAHIDCDLYSSAMDCLKFLDGRLADGAVLLFDDWYCYRGRPDCGVNKAFVEWQDGQRYHVSDYFNYSWAGRAFIVNSQD